jgi:hypothetical protein
MMKIMIEEPEIKWTPETVIRLGGLSRGAVFGFDATAEAVRNGTGLHNCREKARVISDEYMDRTTCDTVGAAATVRFNTDAVQGATVIMRLRHLLPDASLRPGGVLRINGREVAKFEFAGAFAEHRIPLPELNLRSGTQAVEIILTRRGSWQIDHFLLVPDAAN